MDQRSHIKRLAVPSSAGLVGLALLLGGCQSGAQSDLVAREIRLREDKIYEQQDCLDQYEKLICKYRAENNSLKQMLADQNAGEAPPRSPSSTRSRTGDSSPTEAPMLPPTPPARTTEPPDLQIPPLNVPSAPVRPLDHNTSYHEPPKTPSREAVHDVQQTSFAAPAIATHRETSFPPANPQQSVAENAADAPATTSPAPQIVAASSPAASIPINIEPAAAERVWLTGEVVANESGGGPRLLVDVTPLSNAGQPTRFNGELSLMVLAQNNSGPPKNLARWDFPAGEAASARLSSPQAAAGADGANPNTMRFHLELPPETPVNAPVQFWVRLKSDEGHKLLASAPVDFGRPGVFSSVPFGAAPSDQPPSPVVVRVVDHAINASYERPTPAPSPSDGWSIARPGDKDQLAQKHTEPLPTWRASTQPMPMAVAVTPPARPAIETQIAPLLVESPASVAAKPIPEPAPIGVPVWSPERSGKEIADANLPAKLSSGPHLPTISAWSPTR